MILSNLLPRVWSFPKPTVKPGGRVLESGGPLSHRTPCARCWPTPASSPPTARHQPTRPSRLLLTEVWEQWACVHFLTVWGVTCSVGVCQLSPCLFDRRARGRQAEETMGQGSSWEASESVGEGPAQQSLQHLFNKHRRSVDIWIMCYLVFVTK